MLRVIGFRFAIDNHRVDAVDEVLAAGPKHYDYPKGHKPVLALVHELTRRDEAGYIHIKKGDFSLTLK